MAWFDYRFALQLYTWNINEAATLSSELVLLEEKWFHREGPPRHEKACIIQEGHAMYCCFSIHNVWDYACMVQLQNTEMRLIKQVECEDPHCDEPLLTLFEATRGWFKGSRWDKINRLWIEYTWEGPYCIRTVIRRIETGRSVIGFETRILHV